MQEKCFGTPGGKTARKAEEARWGIMALEREIQRLEQIEQVAHATHLIAPSPFSKTQADPINATLALQNSYINIGSWGWCGHLSVIAALKQDCSKRARVRILYTHATSLSGVVAGAGCCSFGSSFGIMSSLHPISIYRQATL